MSELVERHCHASVGGHHAEWALHDDGSWHATYGPHRESGQADSTESAHAAAKAWINVLHKAHTGSTLED